MVLRFSFLFATLLFQFAKADLPTHLAQNAATLKPGQVSFEPYPGANPLVENDFLSRNALSVGLLPRLQIGTIPRPWLLGHSDLQMMNMTTKVSIYQGANFRTSVGLLVSSVDIKTRSKVFDIRVLGTLVQPSWNMNYILNADWDFTYNLSSAAFSFGGDYFDKSKGRIFPIPNQVVNGYLDHVVDIRYAQTGTYYWVFGLSRNYDSLAGMFDQQRPVHGAGVSYGWIMTRGWISVASLGLHFTDRNEVKSVFGLAL